VFKKMTFVILILVLLSAASGLRVSHPSVGLSHALGSANSSLVVLRNTNNLAVGDKIVYVNAIKDASPVLGLISALSVENISANNGSSTENIGKEKIKGKVLFVIPFVGSIIGLIGL